MNLLEYIQGNRKGKAAHRLEREAMSDGFLAEALEGYDTVEGDHVRQIALLRTQLSTRARRVSRLAVYAGIAAGLLFFLAVGSYFMWNRERENFVARNEPPENVSAPMAEDIIPESAPVQAEIPPAVQREQKTEPAALPPPPAASMPENAIAETVGPESEPAVAEEMQETPVVADSLLLALHRQEETESVATVETPKPEADTLTLARQTRPSLKTRDGARLDGFTSENASARRKTSQTPYPKIGMEEYRKYLKESLIRPATGDCAGAKGVVRVEFSIDDGGKPHRFRIRKKLCDEADREAIRLIESGCLWVGDTDKKITVDVSF
jgi:outer membrane biosynthesis protein TonB